MISHPILKGSGLFRQGNVAVLSLHCRVPCCTVARLQGAENAVSFWPVSALFLHLAPGKVLQATDE